MGLYSLYFHNCHNYWHSGHSLGSGTATGHSSPIRVSFDVELEEKNHDSYLRDHTYMMSTMFLATLYVSGLENQLKYFFGRPNYSKCHISIVHSAGEMPLPALYILMSVLFFLSGCFWIFILRKNGTEQVGLPCLLPEYPKYLATLVPRSSASTG